MTFLISLYHGSRVRRRKKPLMQSSVELQQMAVCQMVWICFSCSMNFKQSWPTFHRSPFYSAVKVAKAATATLLACLLYSVGRVGKADSRIRRRTFLSSWKMFWLKWQRYYSSCCQVHSHRFSHLYRLFLPPNQPYLLSHQQAHSLRLQFFLPRQLFLH